jgi:hypothetical protein
MHFLLHDTQVTDKALGPLVTLKLARPYYTAARKCPYRLQYEQTYRLKLFENMLNSAGNIKVLYIQK